MATIMTPQKQKLNDKKRRQVGHQEKSTMPPSFGNKFFLFFFFATHLDENVAPTLTSPNDPLGVAAPDATAL